MNSKSNVRVAKELVRIARELVNPESTGVRNFLQVGVLDTLDKKQYFKDKEGRAIFERWLTGKGIWTNAPFGEYLMKNESLKIQIENYIIGKLIPEFLEGGENSARFSRHVPIELDDNGYDTGYGLLHGTDATVGGFHLRGKLTKKSNTEIDGDFRFQWNDIIDPNPKYILDILKSWGLHILTLGSPEDYVIMIPFESKFKVVKRKYRWVLTGGFPAND